MSCSAGQEPRTGGMLPCSGAKRPPPELPFPGGPARGGCRIGPKHSLVVRKMFCSALGVRQAPGHPGAAKAASARPSRSIAPARSPSHQLCWLHLGASANFQSLKARGRVWLQVQAGGRCITSPVSFFWGVPVGSLAQRSASPPCTQGVVAGLGRVTSH